jgi:alkylhydroperoxidase/carboxymuconolactone decarboxylase family protein YurZ
MASIQMVAEEEATGTVKDIYADIMSTHGIDFVPNMYRIMAVRPDFLATKWSQIKTVMAGEGKLDRMTREIIAVAVSAVSGCDY